MPGFRGHDTDEFLSSSPRFEQLGRLVANRNIPRIGVICSDASGAGFPDGATTEYDDERADHPAWAVRRLLPTGTDGFRHLAIAVG